MVTSASNPYQKYLKATVETASQTQLLVMLFDAAVKKLCIARKALEESDIEISHNELIKVQRIFSELMVALDFEIGGELAQRLFSIYDFVYRQLVQANIKRETKLIDEVMPIVQDLREGWTRAVEKYQDEEQQRPELVREATGDVGPAQPTAQQEAARQVSATSASEAHQDSTSADPTAQTESRKFTPLSPAEYTKTRQDSYAPSSPAPSEPTSQRLNLRG